MNRKSFHRLRKERLSAIKELIAKSEQKSLNAVEISEKLEHLNSVALLKERELWLEKFESLAERYDKQGVYAAILSIALQSPDDTWSGRGNDFRRLINDAKRETLLEIFDWVQYYC